MIEEALDHCAETASLERAVAIIAQARMAVVNQEDWPRLQRWLKRFPAEYVERTPDLLFVKLWVLHSQFRVADCGQVLDRIEALWQQAAPQAGMAPPAVQEAEIAFMRAQNCFWQADLERFAPLVHRALELTPPGYTLMRGNALTYLGMALQMTGAQEAGFARLLDELGNATGRNAALTARLLLALAGMHWAAGSLDHASRFARQLLDVAEQCHLLTSRGWGHFYLGCVHYWRNELAAAADHFGALVERPFGANSVTVVHGHCGLALTYWAQGRSVEAHAVVEALFALATESGSLPLLRQVEAFAARLALLQGKEAAAFAWADQHPETRPWLPMYFLEIRALTLVRILLAQGGVEQLAHAAAVLSTVRTFVTETHNTLRQIDVLALAALLHKARREPQAALDTLHQALLLAEPAAIIRPFVDLGSEMAALLHEAAKQGPAAAFAAQLLAAFPNSGVQALARLSVAEVQPTLSVDPLTDRELEVLSLLGQRLSNKEIAAILVLSPLTVKSHTRNLYAKLQATSRREAVARGQALGLLQRA